MTRIKKISLPTVIFGLLLMVASACSPKLSSTKPVQSPFSERETSLINTGEPDRPMRVFKITDEKDSLYLRSQSTTIAPDPSNKQLQTFIERLYRTVTDSASMGVGIAAPQVGILKNIIWVQRFDKPNFPFEVYLNPKIRQYSKKTQSCREGCLSIPNRTDTLNSRAYAILIEYDMVDGAHEIEMVEDFTAVIFQHEIDHLNGILYLDHLAKEMADAKK